MSAADPAANLAQPQARVEDHDIGPPQFTKVEDSVGLGDIADHGDVRPHGQTGGQSVAEQPARRLHGYPDGFASSGDATIVSLRFSVSPYQAGYARYLAG